MDTQCGVEWTGVELGVEPTSTEEVLSTRNTNPTGLCVRTLRKEGDKTSEMHQVSGPSVLRPQEGLGQVESHSGPVDSQQAHQVRYLQNVDRFANTDPTSPVGSYCLYRSYRRLLASSDSKTVFPLPWFRPGPSKLRIQSYAIRSKCSSKGVHKTYKRGLKIHKIPQRSGYSISGRLVGMGRHPGGVPGVSSKSDVCSRISWVQGEHQEVSLRPSSEVSMAGSSLGLNQPSPQDTQKQSMPGCSFSQRSSKGRKDLSTASGEGYGVSSVCIGYEPNPESQTQRHVSSLEEEGVDQKER